MSRRRRARRILKSVALLAALAALAVATSIGLLYDEHRTALTLPAPTGPYPVGRTTYDWVDHSRTDPLAPDGRPRELPVWIWYPAAPAGASRPADYLPPPWRTALTRYQGPVMRTLFTRDLSLVHAHSTQNAPVAPGRSPYPVVLLRSGIGALATDYTTLAEDLASHGYVVVGMDAPYSTTVVVLPNGQVVTRTTVGNPKLIALWSADTSFVLDQLTRLDNADPPGPFTHRLDPNAVGILGRSFGGATAAQFCHDDTRCRAGIDLDGTLHGTVLHDGLRQPFLFLTAADHGDPTTPANRAALADIRSVYRTPANHRFRLTIQGTGHFNFSDQSLLKDPTLSRLAHLTGPLSPRHALTTALLLRFFDTYLRHHPAHFPGDLTALHPAIHPVHP
ncbi:MULTISPECIES: alpha/beta hydrolase family protein [Streptomycetaceae]|nr:MULTISPECIES: Family membership [Streptomycetaceae]MYS59417.1 family membership [Streptomyces sp. SID5468]CCB75149.1 putative Family membership [Streptantibioticus cattleyicolor NRRL 8057 = DSM 46488]